MPKDRTAIPITPEAVELCKLLKPHHEGILAELRATDDTFHRIAESHKKLLAVVEKQFVDTPSIMMHLSAMVLSFVKVDLRSLMALTAQEAFYQKSLTKWQEGLGAKVLAGGIEDKDEKGAGK